VEQASSINSISTFTCQIQRIPSHITPHITSHHIISKGRERNTTHHSPSIHSTRRVLSLISSSTTHLTSFPPSLLRTTQIDLFDRLLPFIKLTRRIPESQSQTLTGEPYHTSLHITSHSPNHQTTRLLSPPSPHAHTHTHTLTLTLHANSSRDKENPSRKSSSRRSPSNLIEAPKQAPKQARTQPRAPSIALAPWATLP